MLHLHTGKMVYEIRPSVKWNKASTIQWLLTHYFPLEFSENALLIYLGDDKADIEVFDSLRGKGLTIFVGNPQICPLRIITMSPVTIVTGVLSLQIRP